MVLSKKILTHVSHSLFAYSEQRGVSEVPFYESTSPFQVSYSLTSTFDGAFGNTYQRRSFYPNWCGHPYYSPINVEMPHSMLAQNFCGVAVRIQTHIIILMSVVLRKSIQNFKLQILVWMMRLRALNSPI